MRIVHTCLRYPPATGGAERYVQELVERTRDIDAERDVRVLTSKLKTHGPLAELDPELLLDDPPYVQRLHHTATLLVSYPRLQALRYYLGHHQPDIVEAYGYWYQPADVAARFAKRNGLPFIFHPIYYSHGRRKRPVWRLYTASIGRATFAAADVVAVLSPYEQSLIEAAGLPVRRFELLPPGVDLRQYERRRLNPFIKRGIHGRVILAVSRLAQDKGVDETLQAFAQVHRHVSGLNLVIMGEDFGAGPALKRLTERLGVATSVHFWGRANDEELVAAYQHAELFVHASRYEAFGMVLAEALAARVPVVARRVAAVPFVAPHEEAGLLFTTLPEYVGAMRHLLESATLRAKYGAAGQRRVQTQFSWDAVIKKLTGLYLELGKGGGQ